MEKSSMEKGNIWKELSKCFEGHPQEYKIALFLMENGFQIDKNRAITYNGVKIQYRSIGSKLNVDRRTVVMAVEKISKNPFLFKVFNKIRGIAFFRDVGKTLGLGVVIIEAHEPTKPGIVAKVATKMAEYGISTRQLVADDPYLTATPKMTIITDNPLPESLISDLYKLSEVKTISKPEERE